MYEAANEVYKCARARATTGRTVFIQLLGIKGIDSPWLVDVLCFLFCFCVLLRNKGQNITRTELI